MLNKLYSSARKFLSAPIKNKPLRYALPFFFFMAFGLLVVRECSTVRYQFKKSSTLTREDLKRLGIKVGDIPETLEEAYETYQKTDIDNWENIRGPRLWDETPSN